MRRALVGVLTFAGVLLSATPALAQSSSATDVAPARPKLINVQTASCSTPTAQTVVTAGQDIFVSASVYDRDNQSVKVTIELYNSDHTVLLGRLTRPIDTSTTTGYRVQSSQPLQTGMVYMLRAIADDGQLRSDWSLWCGFRVDNRVPKTPTQDTTSFGTTSPMGQVGQRGSITISGGGPATVQYQWTAESTFVFSSDCSDYATFGTDCTTHGDPVTFHFRPSQSSFRICVRAISAAGLMSSRKCQQYVVNP